MNALYAVSKQGTWPEGLDWIALGAFAALMLALPTLGLLFLFRDARRWMRSLRGALVVVTRCLPRWPEWARRETPRCIVALGLRFPCTVQDLKQAYRQKVKQFHPDHGGDQQHFLWLQSQFEQALTLVESRDRTS
jgi:hypothetical protein